LISVSSKIIGLHLVGVFKNRILVGRPDGKRPLGRSRLNWENNIKIDVKEIGWGVDWIELAQDRDRWRALVNAVMNLRIPSNAANYLIR
jgi:hypothetical protein